MAKYWVKRRISMDEGFVMASAVGVGAAVWGWPAVVWRFPALDWVAVLGCPAMVWTVIWVFLLYVLFEFMFDLLVPLGAFLCLPGAIRGMRAGCHKIVALVFNTLRFYGEVGVSGFDEMVSGWG